MTPHDQAARLVAFEGIVRLAKWTDSSSGGPKVSFSLLDRDALAPFEKATRRKGKKSGQRYLLIVADTQGQPVPGAPDECYLLGAQWTHTAGASITFAFESVEYWRRFTTGDQSEEGTQFHITLVEIMADETPVDQVSQDVLEKATKRKGGPKSKHVAQLIQGEDFRTFVGKRIELPEDRWAMTTPDMADKWIKQVCGVESKVDFDYDADAWGRFNNLIRRPFLQWARSYFGEGYGLG